eukprot:636204-Pleurochrysis_carterae.AAC.1
MDQPARQAPDHLSSARPVKLVAAMTNYNLSGCKGTLFVGVRRGLVRRARSSRARRARLSLTSRVRSSLADSYPFGYVQIRLS